jgi:hypothetical protein
MRRTPLSVLIPLLIYGYVIVSWFVNLIKLLGCDFAAPYRQEAIHAIGLLPGVSMITCWF